MSSASSIEWTDTTWNPVVGCAKVSQGCKHCYAETMAARHVLMSAAQGRPSPYLPVVDTEKRRWNGRAVTLPERLAEPLSWRKSRRVFVNSMSDLFHEDVPFEFIAAVFGIMAATSRHTYQVLTKRPARMLEFFAWTERSHWKDVPRAVEFGIHAANHGADVDYPGFPNEWPLPNVWLGVSTEDQQTANERIPLLLQAPAAVRFVSAEPLLGTLDLAPLMCQHCNGFEVSSGPQPWCTECDSEMGMPGWLDPEGIDWVIVGGESGPGARPCDLTWIRSLVRQCGEAQVPCFVKQVGLRPQIEGFEVTRGTVTPLGGGPSGWNVEAFDRHAALANIRNRKGGDPSEWPADLRVRQFPEVDHAR